MREALSLLDSMAGAENQTVQIENLRTAEEVNPEPDQSSTTMPTQDRPPAAEDPQQRRKHLKLAVAFFGIGIAAAGVLPLWSWREGVPLPPTPRIAEEQFSKQSAAPAAKSDSPAQPVAELPPDQSPGGSERQPPTPELAGLNGAVRDAVNSDSAIPPTVPSATDHATSTSRAPWNERVSRRPEHTLSHAAGSSRRSEEANLATSVAGSRERRMVHRRMSSHERRMVLLRMSYLASSARLRKGGSMTRSPGSRTI